MKNGLPMTTLRLVLIGLLINPMTTTVHNKLVRDKIPDICREHGDQPFYHILSDNEYVEELYNKLTEELLEIRMAANPQETAKEIADVLEILRAVAKLNCLSWNDIEDIREEKRQQRGGFERKYFLESTEE